MLFGGATLLVRARAPPETWTTRLQPCGQPEPALVDYLFRLVIIFSNDCSKFEHIAKWSEFRHSQLYLYALGRAWRKRAGIEVPGGNPRRTATPEMPGYFIAACWRARLQGFVSARLRLVAGNPTSTPDSLHD
jgi:hypothetical protein